MSQKASIAPFKPAEILLRKLVNRFFSAKDRGRNLDSYARVYLAFLDFHKLVTKLFNEFEQGMIEHGILDQPRNTYYMRDIEQKIEVIVPEVSLEEGAEDIDTASLCVFEPSKMDKADFAFISGYKK